MSASKQVRHCSIGPVEKVFQLGLAAIAKRRHGPEIPPEILTSFLRRREEEEYEVTKLELIVRASDPIESRKTRERDVVGQAGVHAVYFIRESYKGQPSKRLVFFAQKLSKMYAEKIRDELVKIALVPYKTDYV